MRKAEQRLWDTMRRQAPADAWLQRIENAVTDGMPDVLVILDGFTSWVELKAPSTPARASTPLLGNKEGLRQSQINWHVKAASEGVRSFLLIRASNRELFLLSGAAAAQANEMTRDECTRKSLAVNGTWEEVWQELAA